MDGLLAFGSIILFFMLVVVPVLAVMALNRTAFLRDEIDLLRQRLAALEERGVTPLAATEQPEFSVAADTEEVPVTETEPPACLPGVTEPSYRPLTATGLPIGNWPQPPSPPEQPVQSSDGWLSPAPSVFDGVLSSLVRWFMKGNPLAKLGILLLFIGLSFLLRYTVEHVIFPLELRLAATAFGAVVLLVFGWRLRKKQSVYALILQGGAVGVLYLTVFGAFRLWQMLPMTLAFTLLLVICVASTGLAILQKALSLAMLASLGGYLAPLLLSSGGGSHVALFSFYLLLSGGILVISIWQHWRELNLLGLLFTFGVGGGWGLSAYRPEYYLSCQLFLIANVILFGVLCVALSLRAQEKGSRVVDGVLLFVPPWLGFSIQYAITRDMTWGPALSALGYGMMYIMLAWLALRRFRSLGKVFILASLVLGAVFITLTIPLALSARWTSMAWALEGLGILWLGIQQQERRMSNSGTALLLLAVGSGIWAVAHGNTPLILMMIFTVLSLCWLVAAWLWRRDLLPLSQGLLAGSGLFWLIALSGVSVSVFGENWHAGFGVLGLLSLSVWIWRHASYRLAWPEPRYAVWVLWPAMGYALLMQISQQNIFFAGWDNLAWCLALPSAVMLLQREASLLADKISRTLHLTLFWMLLLAVAMELWWFVSSLPWGMGAWYSGLIMTAASAVIALVYSAIRHHIWPFSLWPEMFGSLGIAPVVPVLAVMLVLANFQDGVVINYLYLPLVNPLEVGAGFALLALWCVGRFIMRTFSVSGNDKRQWLLVLGSLGFWWLNGVLMRALSWYGDVTWSIEALWHSRLIQTCFALFWMMIALIIMLRATRCHSRKKWLAGATLLGVVIVKLMLVDSARGGGLARAVAFIGVAVLLLIIGYFSPLPPREEVTKEPGDEK